MFNPRLFENSRPDGFPVLEIIETPGPEGGSPEHAAKFVPLRRSDLAGEISGPVAAMVLTQRFGFTSQQSSHTIEAVYRFPLPGDASVTGVRVQFGEVEIKAELTERTAGEKAYQDARNEGRQAALLTRESPDTFTLQIAGLRPDEDVTIRTSYAQLARPEGEGWSLRVPLTTAPRFVRSDERGSHHADGQPLALLRDPGHRFTLDLTIEGVGEIASPTHPLDVTKAEDRLRVRLRDGEVVPDRDCVLTWQPKREDGRPSLQILSHDDLADHESCFMALVSPPAAGTMTLPSATIPREVLLLIDHSGSMSGAKWDASDWAVQNLLAGLTSADTFNLGLFHDTTHWFAKSPVRADERAVKQARDFLLSSKDSGGTELGVALEQALSQPRDQQGRARHVLIVTDAQVSDAGRLLDLVEREWTRPDHRRIGVLCIDAAPNSGLANELAERGGGLARFLTSNPAENDIATALDDVLADWAAPVLRGLALEIDHPDVEAAGRRVSQPRSGVSAIDLGDLPAGRAIWVSGRLSGYRGESRTFRLVSTDREEVAQARPESDGARPAIAALFGARRVLELELASSSGVGLEKRLRQLGYDPDEVLGRGDSASNTPPPIYAENARAQAADGVRGLLIREALHYGIACAETAFVATRSEAGQRIDGTVAVANALPSGWSSDFLMPRMAMAGGPAPMFQTFAAVAPMATTPMYLAASPPPPMAPGAMPPAQPTMAPGSPPPGAPMQAPGSSGPAFDLGDIADAATGFFRRITGSSPARRARPSTSDTSETVARDMAGGLSVLFSGAPTFSGGEAVLFDSATSSARLPSGGTLSRLAVRFLDGGPARPIDSGLTLLVFVDDLSSPRARVRLADLVRQGGERPLNIQRRPGQVIRIVLQDTHSTWASAAPRLEVRLG